MTSLTNLRPGESGMLPDAFAQLSVLAARITTRSGISSELLLSASVNRPC